MLEFDDIQHILLTRAPALTGRISPCNTAPRSLMFRTWACCAKGMDLASTPQMRTVRNAATRRLRRRSISLV